MNTAGDSDVMRCRGFSLVEILLAMLITSILILGVNMAYRQAYLVWSDAEDKRPIYHAGRLVTETLRQELSCLYFPQASDDKSSDGSFRLLYLPNEKTELTFYTLAPSWKGSLKSSRIARVIYRFSEGPDLEETLLERSEEPCSGEKIIGKQTSDLVVKGLSDFRIWVADPNASPHEDLWRESYYSRDMPPRALKVRLEWPERRDIGRAAFDACFLIVCQGSLPLSEK